MTNVTTTIFTGVDEYGLDLRFELTEILPQLPIAANERLFFDDRALEGECDLDRSTYWGKLVDEGTKHNIAFPIFGRRGNEVHCLRLSIDAGYQRQGFEELIYELAEEAIGSPIRRYVETESIAA